MMQHSNALGNPFSSLLAQVGPIQQLIFGENASSAAGRSSDGLFMFILWLSVFFFVVLMGLSVYFCIVYRRRPGVTAQRTATHNTALELTWSVVPLLILVVIFFWGFDGFAKSRIAPGEAEQLILTAQKWEWTLQYPNGVTSTERELRGSRTQPIFYVPENKPIQLRMISSDVIHSFWVPDFRIKRDVFPNRYTSFWFQPEPLDLSDSRVKIAGEGTADQYPYLDHMIMCAEYCGDLHSDMLGVLRVVPESVYIKWLASQAFDPEGKMPWEIGQYLYVAKGCVACHTTDGTSGTGPTWTKVWGQKHLFADGSSVDQVDENYIRESILDPAAKVVAGFPNQMTSYQGQVTEEDINNMIAYMKHLAGVDTAPADESSEEGGS